MAIIYVPCDLCGNQEFEPVYAGSLSMDRQDPIPYFSSSRQFATHPPIVRCMQCGLTLSNPRDDPATLHEIYASLQDETYLSEIHNRARTAYDHALLVEKFAQPPGDLLDVGCATGTFVQVAQDLGWQAEGLDASIWAIERAEKLYPKAQFHTGLLEDMKFSSASFDVITMWDVLEHLPGPTKALEQISRWLTPRGWLILNVPNISSWTARFMRERWILLLREHLWYFSPGTIKAMLRKTGFEVVLIQPNYVRFSIANICLRLAQYPGALQGGAGRLSKVPYFAKINVKFPMGEMSVVAKVAAT